MSHAALRSSETEAAMVAVLERACSAFHCPVAELVLLPAGKEEHALRTTVHLDGSCEIMAPLQRAELSSVCRAAARTEGAVFTSGSEAGSAIHGATDDSAADGAQSPLALIAPLRGEDGVLGAIAVAGPDTTDAALDAADLELFDALATHVGAALDYGQVERSLAQLGELERRLAHQAYHDPLTGLANRTLLLDLLQRALVRNIDSDKGVVLLRIDLDDVAPINDGFGHGVAEAVLVEVAGRIARCLRNADTCARLGRDEFAVLMDGALPLNGVISVADRILRALAPPVVHNERAHVVPASVGIAFSSRGASAEGLLRDADLAMHRAKAAGKGRFEIFEESMHADLRRQLDLRDDLARAIHSDELVLHYQPLVELETARMVGVEALVRWEHPERGMVPPNDFIPLAEETGLINALGSWVICEACKQAGEWRARFPFDPPLSMNINVSANQFRERELADELRAAIERNAILPSTLILEITESVFKMGWTRIHAVLDELRELGVRLAIDDFGTGYSSLTRLQEMPVDVLKIPKPFVDALAGVSGKATLARTVVRIGDTIGMKTVAEGIETVEKWQQLRNLGCDYGQGYLFGKPVAASELEAHFERSMAAIDEHQRSRAESAEPGRGLQARQVA